MKKIVLFFFISMCFGLFLQAQPIAEGIQYQAVARDASGKPMSNSPVTLQISLGKQGNNGPVFYSETHEVQTDEQGLFTLIIGEGKQLKGTLAQVPWAEEQIWLDVAVKSPSNRLLNIVSSSRLLTVPYALHAATTSKLALDEEPVEKNQSIYWTTGGNSLTAPPTHFLGTRDNQDLIFKTNNTTRINVTKEGQMKVFSGVTGFDSLATDYPVIIQGSNQGIYIKVDSSRTGANNFVTFGDDVQFSWGAIEGQTFPELEAYWAYQLQVTLYALNAAANVGLLITQALAAAGAFVSVCCAGSGPGLILDVVAIGVDLANIIASSITWGINIRRDIGVSYSSGNADYAEWLERAPGERDLFAGEIIGVKGGQVTLNTENADHFLVVSSNPAVIGNLPPTKDLNRYEMIAFMGQVPVRVLGPVAVGDYILPSGNHDGFAIAVNPDNMKIGDYARIIGVSWQPGMPNMPFNFVNVAIGINSNDLSREVVALEQKVESIMAYLQGESQSLIPEDKNRTVADFFSTVPPLFQKKQFSDEEFDLLLDENAPLFKEIFAQAKKSLAEKGYNLNEQPQMLAFLDNPVPAMKQLRRDPSFLSQWAQFDQTLYGAQKK